MDKVFLNILFIFSLSCVYASVNVSYTLAIC